MHFAKIKSLKIDFSLNTMVTVHVDSHMNIVDSISCEL